MARNTQTGLMASVALRCACLFTLAAISLQRSAVALAPASLAAAEQALQQGQINEVETMLRPIIQTDPHNGQARLLLCRAFISEEAIDPAVAECEAAAASLPSDSAAHDWLGRAYGMKAAHAGPFSGFSLARKVRDSFETAVRLNPHDGDAFDDLGQYYLAAPGVVGGGVDKAIALANQGTSVLPERARALRAGIAEKQKDYATAEREFRGLAQDTGRPDAWVDLGSYYGRRSQNDQAIAALRHAIEIDKARDNSLAHAADALIQYKLEPQLAMQALRSYLTGPALSDFAPACKVHTQLGRLLAATGDKAAAKMEFQKALALAGAYLPAQKELRSL
jgi:tetratricopeptide (TPR) repeat protein